MKTYARVEAGRVVELLTTAADITKLFHPSLRWVAVTDAVQIGWLQQADGFVAPPVVAASLQGPTPAELQARLAQLAVEIAALQPHS